jgi:hypothetical protein
MIVDAQELVEGRIVAVVEGAELVARGEAGAGDSSSRSQTACCGTCGQAQDARGPADATGESLTGTATNAHVTAAFLFWIIWLVIGWLTQM